VVCVCFSKGSVLPLHSERTKHTCTSRTRKLSPSASVWTLPPSTTGVTMGWEGGGSCTQWALLYVEPTSSFNAAVRLFSASWGNSLGMRGRLANVALWGRTVPLLEGKLTRPSPLSHTPLQRSPRIEAARCAASDPGTTVARGRLISRAVMSLATDPDYSFAFQTAQLLHYVDMEECSGVRAYDSLTRGGINAAYAQLVPQVGEFLREFACALPTWQSSQKASLHSHTHHFVFSPCRLAPRHD
jgi:hypothetical protein